MKNYEELFEKMEINKKVIKKFVVKQNFIGRIATWIILSICGFVLCTSCLSEHFGSLKAKGSVITGEYRLNQFRIYYGLWAIVVIIYFLMISFVPLILIDLGKFIIFEDKVQNFYERVVDVGGENPGKASLYYVYFENLNRAFNKRLKVDRWTYKKLDKGYKYYIVYIPLMFKYVIIREGFYLADSIKKHEANQATLFRYFGR